MHVFYHLIVNPTAGGDKAQQIAAEVIAFMNKEHVGYKMYTTSYPHHEAKIAAELKKSTLLSWENYQGQPQQDFPLLIVVGGDGTLHQVINQLAEDIPLGYIPAGTGNDFARGLSMPSKLTEILQHLLQVQAPQKINLLQYREVNETKSQVCVNNLGIGLDANIVYTTNHSARKKNLNKVGLSSLSYIRSLFSVLLKQPGFAVTLGINQHEHEFKRAFLCTLTNHPYFGGGVKIAPMASISENSIDFLLVERLPMFRIFGLIFLLCLQKHTSASSFHHFKGKKIYLSSPTAQFLQADGEAEEKAAHELIISCRDQLFWY